MTASKISAWKITAIPALVLAAAAISACDGGSDVASPGAAPDLTVTYSPWNGWDRGDGPAPVERELAGVVGERLELEVHGGIDIEVVEVDGDEVRLEVSQRMAPASPGGGIDLNNLTDTFVVTAEEPAVFSTATTDGGWTFEVSA